MPRGVGPLQTWLLLHMYKVRELELITEDSWAEDEWCMVSRMSLKPRVGGIAATAKHRSERSVVRRAIYGLQKRGLVECRVEGQLEARITDLGMALVESQPKLVDDVRMVRRQRRQAWRQRAMERAEREKRVGIRPTDE